MHRTIISSDRVVFTEDSSCFNANFCKHFNPMTRFDALLVNIPPKLWDIFFLRVEGRFIWSRLTQICVEYNFKEISLFCLIFMLAHFIGNTVSLLFQVIAFLLVEPSNPFRLVGIQINKCSLLVATWFFTQNHTSKVNVYDSSFNIDDWIVNNTEVLFHRKLRALGRKVSRKPQQMLERSFIHAQRFFIVRTQASLNCDQNKLCHRQIYTQFSYPAIESTFSVLRLCLVLQSTEFI